MCTSAKLLGLVSLQIYFMAVLNIYFSATFRNQGMYYNVTT